MAFGQNVQVHLLQEFINKPKVWILSHDFATRTSKKPIKNFKDSDHSQVSKKYLNQKNGLLG